MTVRREWSDDRIDGLELKVDEGFRQVDRRFEQVDKRFEQVDKRFEQLDSRLDRIEKAMGERFIGFESRLQSLDDGLRGFHRMLLALCAALLTTFIGTMGALITILVTQL